MTDKNTWIKITAFPLIVGFALIINMEKIIFKVIGWGLLIFGFWTGIFYLYKIYKFNKEKINNFLKIFRKKK